MSDLFARLETHRTGDHQRGCMGRQYSCTCGYDDVTEHLLEEAANAIGAQAMRLDAAEAENARLVSLVERLTTPTDEMIDAFFKAQNAYAEPYPPEFESGVEMDSGLDQETADQINDEVRATFREGWKVALSNSSTVLGPVEDGK